MKAAAGKARSGSTAAPGGTRRAGASRQGFILVDGLPLDQLVKLTPKQQAERQRRWPLGEARQLIREGYNLAHVMHRTGHSLQALDDLVRKDDPHFGEAWRSRRLSHGAAELSS